MSDHNPITRTLSAESRAAARILLWVVQGVTVAFGVALATATYLPAFRFVLPRASTLMAALVCLVLAGVLEVIVGDALGGGV